MDQRGVLESYLLEIIARARSARERAEALLAYDFVSHSPVLLAKTISRICVFLETASFEIFKQASWDYPDELEQDIHLLRSADLLVQYFAAHLRYVESARSERLPWGLISALDKLVCRLAPEIQVMLRPKWNYNYSLILSDFRSGYLTALEELADFVQSQDLEQDVLTDMRQPFHIISFPALERENILLHTLLGHELGHFFVDRFLTQQRRGAFLKDIVTEAESLAIKELQDGGLTEESYGPLFLPQIRKALTARNVQLASRYWSRAVEEIISDMVGAVLFGPAALFSTYEMAIQQGYDVEPDPRRNFYPPWRLRLRAVLNIVDSQDSSSSFFPVDAATFPSPDAATRTKRVNSRYTEIRNLTEINLDDYIEDFSHIARLAYRRVLNDVDEGIEVLLSDSKLCKARAQPDFLYRNMPYLISRLDQKIPPSALESHINDRRSIGFVEIINSAWLQRVASRTPVIGEDGGLNESLVSKRKLENRLTLKAIEFADLAEDYWDENKVDDFLTEE